jgi:disulfide bond formation protein DsbB
MEPFILNRVLSTGTLVLDIMIVLFVLFFFVQRVRKQPLSFPLWITRNVILLAFIMSLSGTILSLVYSDLVGFVPCVLCWYQRIFMYSLAIILGIAWAKKRKDVIIYAIPLAVFGLLVAIYHYVLQLVKHFGGTIIGCTGGTVDCAETYFFHYGYISMPAMAITSFLLIIFFLYLAKRNA